jgi:lambda family phage portal protein
MKSSSSNFLDRAIGFVAPSWQLRRMQHRSALRIMARYYEAGDVSRRTQEWKRPSGDPNAVTGVSLARLRDAARHLVRNNGYAESAIGTIQDDVVGWGIWPTAKHDAWKEWTGTTQIDADGRSDLPGLQELVMRTVIESGECLVRRRIRRLSDGLAIPLQMQILEPDFIDSSKHRALEGGRRIVRGIEFDALGRRVAYWLYKNHPGSSTISKARSLGESSRVPASEILHVFKMNRPGQVRGASWFAPVLIRIIRNIRGGIMTPSEARNLLFPES